MKQKKNFFLYLSSILLHCRLSLLLFSYMYLWRAILDSLTIINHNTGNSQELFLKVRSVWRRHPRREYDFNVNWEMEHVIFHVKDDRYFCVCETQTST